MNVLIILAHPNPESYNAAICDAAEQEFKDKQYNVRKRDLYRMNFNPVLTENSYSHFYQDKIPADIQAEQKDITWADFLVFCLSYMVVWNASDHERLF